jgi:hypothetical protein
MTLKEIIYEFGKGCSNTVGKNPAECEECLNFLVLMIEKHCKESLECQKDDV